jgi:hypothetical protein
MKQNKNEANVLKPVKEYREPVYPGKEAFIDNPSLLLNYAPPSWMKTKLSAATLLVFALNTCQGSRNEDLNRQDTRMVEQKDIKQTQKSVTQKKISIAPLFFHGEGTGATGCVVISPPSFLSEADAIELIRAKLKKEKIIFDKQDYVLNGVYSLDEFEFLNEYNDKKPATRKLKRRPFYFDFYSSRYNLGIKFISSRSYFNLTEIRSELQDKIEPFALADNHPGRRTDLSSIGSSVYVYDMIETVQRVREYLKKYAQINAAFFYDPLVKPNRSVITGISLEMFERDLSKLEKQGDAKQLLEQQVNDFVVWFKNIFDEPEKRRP